MNEFKSLNPFKRKEAQNIQIWNNSRTEFSPDKFPIFSVHGKIYKLWYEEGYKAILIRVVPIETKEDFKDTLLYKIAEVGFQKQEDGMYTGYKLDSKKEKGLARAMYDFVDLKFGKIRPSDNQSSGEGGGKEFWEKNKKYKQPK
jgi:hypothetical protein